MSDVGIFIFGMFIFGVAISSSLIAVLGGNVTPSEESSDPPESKVAGKDSAAESVSPAVAHLSS